MGARVKLHGPAGTSVPEYVRRNLGSRGHPNNANLGAADAVHSGRCQRRWRLRKSISRTKIDDGVCEGATSVLWRGSSFLHIQLLFSLSFFLHYIPITNLTLP